MYIQLIIVFIKFNHSISEEKIPDTYARLIIKLLQTFKIQ